VRKAFRVNGALIVTGGETRLCEALAESFPPQCGGERLIVEGLDLSAFDLTESSGVRWSDQPVQVLGIVIDDERLVVSGVSQ
jgi:hypothetical protein